MTDGLTARQTLILKAVVDEYIETALPVGSLSLEKKHNLGISPATIRNEMMALTRSGYLKQPHTSAGRIPTPVAMKFYINQLMEEKQIGVVEEVQNKEDVWDSRHDFDELMESATRTLALRTKALAVGTTTDGSVWSHGHSHVFNNPEFSNYHVCQNVFALLDQERLLKELFFERLTGLTPIEVLFGEELGWDYFEPIGIVATRFQTPFGDSALAIIGPFRLNYPSVIPTVRYFGNLIQELSNK
jgi:transcriptional regulator of heat shock response